VCGNLQNNKIDQFRKFITLGKGAPGRVRNCDRTSARPHYGPLKLAIRTIFAGSKSSTVGHFNMSMRWMLRGLKKKKVVHDRTSLEVRNREEVISFAKDSVRNE
jgi:hypothetical protein